MFRELWGDKLKHIGVNEQESLGLECLHSNYFEEKSFGIHLLNKVAMKKKKTKPEAEDCLEKVETLFEEGEAVYDWATCDMLCGKVGGYPRIATQALTKPGLLSLLPLHDCVFRLCLSSSWPSLTLPLVLWRGRTAPTCGCKGPPACHLLKFQGENRK